MPNAPTAHEGGSETAFFSETILPFSRKSSFVSPPHTHTHTCRQGARHTWAGPSRHAGEGERGDGGLKGVCMNCWDVFVSSIAHCRKAVLGVDAMWGPVERNVTCLISLWGVSGGLGKRWELQRIGDALPTRACPPALACALRGRRRRMGRVHV
jgi:hypothetical protein